MSHECLTIIRKILMIFQNVPRMYHEWLSSGHSGGDRGDGSLMQTECSLNVS